MVDRILRHESRDRGRIRRPRAVQKSGFDQKQMLLHRRDFLERVAEEYLLEAIHTRLGNSDREFIPVKVEALLLLKRQDRVVRNDCRDTISKDGLERRGEGGWICVVELLSISFACLFIYDEVSHIK